MTQRAKTRGIDLKPDPVQHAGTINAEKCIRYLRGIGCEIDDATADTWLDAQGVHRFLASEKQADTRFESIWCRCGERSSIAIRGKRRHVKRAKGQTRKIDESDRCPECKTFPGHGAMRLLYVIRRDGTEVDYRDASEQWEKFDWRGMLGA